MATAPNYYYALGRRKTSTASVRLQKGKGVVTINGKSPADYFAGSKAIINKLNKPFSILELESNSYDVSIKVQGGGINGQADAIVLGISKAFAIMNEDLKPTLKKADMLGRDPREKERKKFGLRGARKQRQFTKR